VCQRLLGKRRKAVGALAEVDRPGRDQRKRQLIDAAITD
jgi:hypothetical protein